MNAIFLFLFLSAAVGLLWINPELFLPTLLDAAGDSATLCVALLASYAVWMGLMQVWEESGISRKISRLLRPICRKLFKTNDEETLQTISINLSCNMLGLGGAATPYGVRAAALLSKSPHPEYASCMFFVLNATSLQILPTSVVGLRASLGSGAPADIILPTFICTAVSTITACLLSWLFLHPKRKHHAPKTNTLPTATSPLFSSAFSFNKGAGTR